MRAGMSLQVECVIETFATERTQVPLYVRVAFHVSVKKTLQCERFRADLTGKFVRIVIGNGHRCLLAITVQPMTVYILNGKWILETMTTIHEFQLYLRRQSQL